MKIESIRYPEGCQLKGWSKMVFERRIRQTLGSFFSVCDLDRCRAEILGQEPDKELYGELSLFHCEPLKGMSAAEAQALTDKVARYVGIGITVKRPSRVPTIVVGTIAGVVLVMVGILMASAMKAKSKAAETRTPDLASLPIISPLLPPVGLPEVQPEPIFNTTIRTSRPAATARVLARAVQGGEGEYEVSLTVTPVPAVAE